MQNDFTANKDGHTLSETSTPLGFSRATVTFRPDINRMQELYQFSMKDTRPIHKSKSLDNFHRLILGIYYEGPIA